MITPEVITELKHNEVFVFGSNLSGIHGAGAANFACKKGWTIWGAGVGLIETSFGKSYAIATKDYTVRKLEVNIIQTQISLFLQCSLLRPELTFLVTPIGCGLAGYKPDEMAKLFFNGVDHGNWHKIFPNIHLPQSFWDTART